MGSSPNLESGQLSQLATYLNVEPEELIRRVEELRVINGDFRHFLDNHAQIEDKITFAAIPFKLWPSQIRILPDFLTAPRLAILKARQLGLTWLTAAYCLWLAITRPLQHIVVISAKEEWAVEFLDRVKFIMQRLPEWMVPPLDQESQTQLRFLHHDGLLSTIQSLTTTPSGAQSKTPTLLVLDETARNRYVRSIYASSKPGIDAGAGRIIIISNSIKDGVGWGWTRQIVVDALKGLIDFKTIFMGWFDHPHRPKSFIRDQVAEGMDPEDVSWHYPSTIEEAISAIAGSYFGSALQRHDPRRTMRGDLGRIVKGPQGELDFIEDPNGIVEIWRYPYNQLEDYDGLPWVNRYCLGSDVSEGVGQTNSVAYVKDRLLDEFVCKIKHNRIDADEWAEQLHLLAQYYGDFIPQDHEHGEPHPSRLCVERNGAGITTIKRLRRLGANLYLRLIEDKQKGVVTTQFGWQQSNQAIHEMSNDLKEWFRIMGGTLYDATLIDEASTTILHENGKIGPMDEQHYWDHVVAAGMTQQACNSLGAPPKKVKEGPKGWLAAWQKGEL